MVSSCCVLLIKTAITAALLAPPIGAWYEPCEKSGRGKEPNYDDMGCHSYYECHDHWGELKHCEHGYQFDYYEKECLKDEEVLCKWQISDSEKSSAHGSSHGPFRTECHEEHGKEPDYRSEHCETYYECDHHHGFLQHCPHGHQFDWHDKECYEDKKVHCQEQRHNSGGNDEHHSGYECHEEHGKEPDYRSEHCETYFECHDHHGVLQHCPHGKQFDWHDKECYEDKYVYCQEQRSKYRHGHSDQTHEEEEEHHDDFSLDWLYMMSLQNSLSGGSSGGGEGNGGTGEANVGGANNLALLAALGGLGGLGVGLLQGNALQGNALQGQGVQGNALPDNGIQGNVLQPNQGLNPGFPQLNPTINVGAPNINQVQVAGAGGLNPGINQGQGVLFPQASRTGGASSGRAAVELNQTQAILVNQEGKVLTPVDRQDEHGRPLYLDQDGNLVARSTDTSRASTNQLAGQPVPQPLPQGQSPSFIPPPPRVLARTTQLQLPNTVVVNGRASVANVDVVSPSASPSPADTNSASSGSAGQTAAAVPITPHSQDTTASWLQDSQATLANDARLARRQPADTWQGMLVPDDSAGQWLLGDSDGTWVLRTAQGGQSQ